jgi:hypothetical protein
MKRISSGTMLRRRSIDELDTDLLTTLEELDKRLYAVLSQTRASGTFSATRSSACAPGARRRWFAHSCSSGSLSTGRSSG